MLFEGIPNYPDASRLWHIVDKHRVTQFYTAPTAIRSLICQGDDFLKTTKRTSLEILGSVGEAINPDPWLWYYEKVGNKQAPVMDTWWQTETGGIAITPLPGVTPLKPGSATLPFFGIQPALLQENGTLVEGPGKGRLCIASSWPGQMRTIYADHQKCLDTYFNPFPGYYFSGDGALRDQDGYYWLTGRVDDVLNISGHRLGSAEIEHALVQHPQVAEAAVVGIPHPIKGEGIYAYVTLKEGTPSSDALQQELIQTVRTVIGPIATIDTIHWARNLPKTRSGKIMRRILRKIATASHEDLGDTSTLADPSVINELLQTQAASDLMA